MGLRPTVCFQSVERADRPTKLINVGGLGGDKVAGPETRCLLLGNVEQPRCVGQKIAGPETPVKVQV